MISSDWVESDDLVKPEISGKIQEKIIGDTKKTSASLDMFGLQNGNKTEDVKQLIWFVGSSFNPSQQYVLICFVRKSSQTQLKKTEHHLSLTYS